MVPTPTDERGFEGNRLLAALPDDELDGLRGLLEVVYLDYKQVVTEPGEPIEHVYIPLNCIVSMVAEMDDGQMVGHGRQRGHGGFARVPREKDHPPGLLLPGEGLRREDEVERSEEQHRPQRPVARVAARLYGGQLRLRRPVERVQQAALHRAAGEPVALALPRQGGQRRVPAHPGVPLADAGVRRASVSEVSGRLQREGLISYTRGNIRVKDRLGLENTSCECYRVIEEEFDELPS